MLLKQPRDEAGCVCARFFLALFSPVAYPVRQSESHKPAGCPRLQRHVPESQRQNRTATAVGYKGHTDQLRQPFFPKLGDHYETL